MYSSYVAFTENISSARELAVLHEYLCANLISPMKFDDLLRFQIIYAVSALDKLVHDVVRIGMLETFTGKRSPTAKYLSEKLTMSAYGTLASATVPPKEYYFEQEIISKLRFVSYQSPDSIADGLSYIWEEKCKWKKIASAMGMMEDQAKTQLRLIVDRRNKIAHEADRDIVSGGRFAIAQPDSESALLFIEKCGEKIISLVE